MPLGSDLHSRTGVHGRIMGVYNDSLERNYEKRRRSAEPAEQHRELLPVRQSDGSLKRQRVKLSKREIEKKRRQDEARASGKASGKGGGGGGDDGGGDEAKPTAASSNGPSEAALREMAKQVENSALTIEEKKVEVARLAQRLMHRPKVAVEAERVERAVIAEKLAAPQDKAARHSETEREVAKLKEVAKATVLRKEVSLHQADEASDELAAVRRAELDRVAKDAERHDRGGAEGGAKGFSPQKRQQRRRQRRMEEGKEAAATLVRADSQAAASTATPSTRQQQEKARELRAAARAESDAAKAASAHEGFACGGIREQLDLGGEAKV